mmetsp:Transcript_14447/g.23608  ORF Transcript_14447/g.23608 Transcript_14447/m.23608 type:complete len:202 (+) Transcript_14447:801-1406(+)
MPWKIFDGDDKSSDNYVSLLTIVRMIRCKRVMSIPMMTMMVATMANMKIVARKEVTTQQVVGNDVPRILQKQQQHPAKELVAGARKPSSIVTIAIPIHRKTTMTQQIPPMAKVAQARNSVIIIRILPRIANPKMMMMMAMKRSLKIPWMSLPKSHSCSPSVHRCPHHVMVGLLAGVMAGTGVAWMAMVVIIAKRRWSRSRE